MLRKSLKEFTMSRVFVYMYANHCFLLLLQTCLNWKVVNERCLMASQLMREMLVCGGELDRKGEL